MTTRVCRNALIVTGIFHRSPAYLDAGLRSLRWLMTHTDGAIGLFRPSRL